MFAIVTHFSPYNEPDLLQQLKAGNENAFAQLFHHYRATVYSVAFKFLRSPVLAEEIVQDVFLKLWLKREELGDVKRMDAYLFVMARNFIFDRIKKMAYETAGKNSLPQEPLSPDNPEYLVRQHECERLLQQAIELLPGQQKQVYKLAKVDGLSHEVIAERMQLSKHTVKKHMAMALQAIRKYLDTHLHHFPLLPLLAAAFLFNY